MDIILTLKEALERTDDTNNKQWWFNQRY